MLLCISMAFLFLFSFSRTLQAQEHSPEVALRWSILPGGGQVYNKQAWKVPIIYGAFASMGYLIHTNYSYMKMFKDEYLYRVNHNGATNLSGYEQYSSENIYSLYNSYNRDFQLMIIITVGIYALNLIDAYVFGHLFDFQIDDDISLVVVSRPGYGLCTETDKEVTTEYIVESTRTALKNAGIQAPYVLTMRLRWALLPPVERTASTKLWA